jgi:hypothetical protein
VDAGFVCERGAAVYGVVARLKHACDVGIRGR